MCESTFAADAGEYARAESLCRAALSHADRSDRAAALRQLAAIALRAGDSQKAARQCLTAARAAQDAGDELSMAECLVDLGHILSGLNRIAAARLCFRSAAVRFRNGGHLVEAGAAENWLRETSSIARLLHSDPSAN
jgi:tetratricopeptide (TPR) repeat protein